MTAGAPAFEDPTRTGPLAGVRVLEVATGRPARIAAMLLADLGADVVRVGAPGAPGGPAGELSPEAVCWDRGKRIWSASAGDAAELAEAADVDVVLVDVGPSALAGSGLDAPTLRRNRPGLVHLWMPPYGEEGEWKDTAEDPLLLAALSVAPYFYLSDDGPIASVSPILTYLHAAVGAAAAVAALIGRERQGTAQPAVVTGLHAVAALMGTALARVVDGPQVAPGRDSKGVPNWRVYQCGDGEWIYLAALTPDIFFRALDAMDRLDVMALPDVGGDWQNLMAVGPARDAVTAELEAVMAAQSSGYWRARFAEVRVPCATVSSREHWLTGPIVTGNQGRVELAHPTLGPVAMPDAAITFDRTPAGVRSLAAPIDGGRPWPVGSAPASAIPSDPPVSAGRTRPLPLPLAGIRVLDGTSFVAGPTISALLADFGADVIRLEPPGGDTYRAYSLSFLTVNQRKRGITVDLKGADGRATLHRVLAGTDIYTENLRPHAVADLDLGEETGSARFPGLVHCSLSAFGRAEDFADQPGFDPVFQLLSGMARAQGGPDRPSVGGAPGNDVASGALGALGSLAALYHRLRGGSGQRLWVSLAASAGYLQSAEFTTWPGSPPPPVGGADFRGPGAGNRFYRCTDGWIAVATNGDDGANTVARALGLEEPGAIESALAAATVAAAVARISGSGVPVVRVVPNEVRLADPFLVANDVGHVVPTPDGAVLVVDHYSRWPEAVVARPGAFFGPGEHNEEVLDAAGP